MPVIGSTTLPVAPRAHRWDGAAARRRVFDACTNEAGTVNVACVSRAFLWRAPGTDGTALGHYSLGFADWIDGRLQIVPRGIAATTGGRGVGAADIPEADADRIRMKICRVYDRVRQSHEDWPDCPWGMTASIQAAASGPGWEGVIAFEGQTTGDERRIAKGALRWENLPLPLLLGHRGQVIGTVDEIERDGAKIIGRGHFSESEVAEVQAMIDRARELVTEGAVGVSVGYDDDEAESNEDGSDGLLTISDARIRHVAIEDTAAFNRAQIALVAAADESWFADPRFGYRDGQAPASPLDGEHDERLVYQEPERPEEDRQLGCPLTITDDGRIFGHVALWGRCHVGHAGTCLRPPKEPAAYRGFLTGARIPGVATGPIVMKTNHPSLHASAEEAQRHYHDTGLAAADVTVFPDVYGIAAAGAVREGTTQADIEALRGSALSGDWRPAGTGLRLVGLLAVNAPGYRVSRALAASGALITSGPGCTACAEERPMVDRLDSLEDELSGLKRLYAQSLIAGLD